MTTKAKTEVKGPPSIKAWLATRLPKGKATVADAVKYASDTGRSDVTVRRMAAVLGYRAKAGVFVKADKVRK